MARARPWRAYLLGLAQGLLGGPGVVWPVVGWAAWVAAAAAAAAVVVVVAVVVEVLVAALALVAGGVAGVVGVAVVALAWLAMGMALWGLPLRPLLSLRAPSP